MVQGALGRSAGESIMSNITVRPMTPEDWAAVSEIYLEGIATVRNLAKNMTFLMKSIALGKAQFGLPELDPVSPTHFIR